MALLDYLDKVRQKPERERQRLVLCFSILITVVLAGLWLLSLRFTWQNSGEPAPAVKEATATSTAEASAWANLVDSFKNSALQIKTGWQTITNQK